MADTTTKETTENAVATTNDELGGRLPLLQPAELNGEAKDFYDQLCRTMLPWSRESGFVAEGDSGEVVGPFNALLYNPAAGAAQMAYLKAERESTTLSPQVREVVILTVGAVWKAAYELYAHRAVAAKAGIGDADIEALSAGDPPMGLGKEAIMAHRFVHAIAKQHYVVPTLYAEARAMFGDRGLVDMLHLAGLYMTVSALLNAFAVPTPAAE